MPLTLRVTCLRLAILVALVASTLLTVDHVREGPAFCPLEQACNKARDSELGSLGGVPTSTLGLGAFLTLLLLTLPSPRFSKYLLAPAGTIAAGAGVCLLLHQAFVLRSFCPLCVVVDSAAIVSGLLILGWSTPIHHRKWGTAPEPMAHKVAWTLAASLIVVAPFAMRRSAQAEPAWEEVTPLTAEELAFEVHTDATSALDVSIPPPAGAFETDDDDCIEDDDCLDDQEAPVDAAPVPVDVEVVADVPPPSETVDEMVAVTEVPPELAVEPSSASAEAAPVPEPLTTSTSPETAEPKIAVGTASALDIATDSVDEPKPEPVEEPALVVVEYLNAYCKHCRKTYRRLEKVLGQVDVPIQRRRIYTWASNDYPVWARALAYAQKVGREDELFEELIKSRSDRRGEVIAAARRAGLDVWALRRALADTVPPLRLVKDRSLAGKARLKGLPTIDIGRRRLMGEQSEATLRSAVSAALTARARR